MDMTTSAIVIVLGVADMTVEILDMLLMKIVG
jgi:hypothetical protein